MPVAAVPLPLTVTPKPDAHGDPPRDPRRPSTPRRRDRNDGHPDEHHPFLNSYGEVIGQTIHVTA